MKYFSKEEQEKILLSTYLIKLKELIKEKEYLYLKKDVKILEYLIKLFGDIELEESLIKVYIDSYRSFGGRYSVKSDDETLKSLQDIKKKYPSLTSKAIDDLSFCYIKDLFDEYSLDKVLKDFIETYGETDLSFEKYLEFVDKIGEIHQKQFDESAEEIEYLKDEYGERLVEYLQFKIKREHISKDKILKYLPDKELIKKDEEQLLEFATKSRIHFGICYPISYELIIEMIKDKELSIYPEELKYKSSFGRELRVTFTKSEFIESTKKKQKIK